jgi:hypothetical protein
MTRLSLRATIGRYLRDQIHARLDLHFHAGDHVLGRLRHRGGRALSGDRGVHVTAPMSAKDVEDRPRKSAIRSLPLQISIYAGYIPFTQAIRHFYKKFDAIFLTLAALNCPDDWKPLAAWLSERQTRRDVGSS